MDDELLAHLPEYGIVICRTCEFAIQPSALSSHLLRHQIYRHDRQKLLSSLSKLHLLEPEQVPAPPADLPPFEHLTVSAGYKCNVDNCGYLSISRKRISQHCREQHGSSISIDRDVSAVWLQTFFKGNKVRYFEVKRSDPPEVTDPARLPTPGTIPASDRNDTGSSSTADSETTNVGYSTISEEHMQTLMYFHHYITCTGLTLSRGTETTDFWTHVIPEYASAQPYLMHAMLGVSAFHRAFLSTDPKERHQHQSQGIMQQSAGLALFHEVVKNPTTANSTGLVAFPRLLGVQSCARALLLPVDAGDEEDMTTGPNMTQVLEFLLLIRGGCDLLMNMQDILPLGSEFILPVVVRAGLEELGPHQGALTGLASYIFLDLYHGLGHSEAYISNSKNLLEVLQLARLCAEAAGAQIEHPITYEWIEQVVPSSFCTKFHATGLAQTLNESRARAQILYNDAQIQRLPTPLPPNSCYPNLKPEIYAHFSTLMQNFTRTEIAQPPELDACSQAVAALMASFSRSNVTPRIWAVWNGIESWPRMLSDKVLGMIEGAHPLALILVAHWCLLIRKQEVNYWFFAGQSKRLLRLIEDNMEHEMRVFMHECLTSFPQAAI